MFGLRTTPHFMSPITLVTPLSLDSFISGAASQIVEPYVPLESVVIGMFSDTPQFSWQILQHSNRNELWVVSQ